MRSLSGRHRQYLLSGSSFASLPNPGLYPRESGIAAPAKGLGPRGYTSPSYTSFNRDNGGRRPQLVPDPPVRQLSRERVRIETAIMKIKTTKQRPNSFGRRFRLNVNGRLKFYADRDVPGTRPLRASGCWIKSCPRADMISESCVLQH